MEGRASRAIAMRAGGIKRVSQSGRATSGATECTRMDQGQRGQRERGWAGSQLEVCMQRLRMIVRSPGVGGRHPLATRGACSSCAPRGAIELGV